MGQHFAKAPIGIFVFSDKEELSYFRFFSKSAERAVDEFSRAQPPKEMPSVEDDFAYAALRKNFREFAKNLGFAESDVQLNAFLSDFGYALSKKRLAGAITKDRLIVQSSNALDDIDKIINLLQERLYEWFTLHYPEAKNTKDFSSKIALYRRRENFPDFRGSTGVEIEKRDEEAFASFATQISSLAAEKARLEDYIEQSVRETAPNLSSLISPLLAAKLIAYAGSLDKLSRMPASTIQLLGAEKALFRHLHKKGRPPKYGIIFTAAAVQAASQDAKGKAARILAAKLMQAARIDYYSGRFEERLRSELNEELKRL